MHAVCLCHSGPSVIHSASLCCIESGRVDDDGEDDNAVHDGPRDKGYDVEDKGKSSTATGGLIVATLVMVLGLEGGGGERDRRGDSYQYTQHTSS